MTGILNLLFASISSANVIEDVLIFYSSGEVIIPDGVTEVEYVVVGGGKGGRGIPRIAPQSNGGAHGGGGAGGFRIGSGYPVTPGATIAITVQAGLSFQSGPGSNFDTITSAPGGAGAAWSGGSNINPGQNGGSGGGGGYWYGFSSPAVSWKEGAAGLGNVPATVPSQGNDGGSAFNLAPSSPNVRVGGGGGGAGAVGTTASPSTFGSGGDGLATSISGVSTYYAGGGGGGYIGTPIYGDIPAPGGLGGGGNGGFDNPTVTPRVLWQNGQANTGGGAGGIARVISSSGLLQIAGPANGGSGIVILKWSRPIGSYTYVFKETTSWVVSSNITSIDYLVVGGGGGGGSRNSSSNGGGGAGGFRVGTAFPVTGGGIYDITVGAGGAAASPRGISGGLSSITLRSSPNPTVTDIVSAGGGGAGNNAPVQSGGFQGGSGGGGRPGGLGNIPAFSTSQGNVGGTWARPFAAGGGGGASAVGADGSSADGSNGGDGTASSISGTSVTYSGGGGSGAFGPVGTVGGTGGTGGGGDGGSDGVAATAGAVNTGGGGGGRRGGSPDPGAAGGSGIVIIVAG